MSAEHWPRVKISELCDLIVDCVNKTAPRVDYNTPYKMIRTPNIKNGKIDLTGCRYVEKETYEKWTRRATVDKGDVLLTREAPMGEVGLVNFEDTVFLGQRIMQYRANPKKLDSNYLLYAFLSPNLQYQFRKHDSTGSTVSHIRVPDCSEFEISTPPLGMQKKMSKALRNIDDKIELNNRINAELEAMAKTLYDYWFVQFDFPDDSPQGQGKPYKSSGGTLVYNPTLKREIPEGWNDVSLVDVATFTNGIACQKYYPSGDEPTYKVIKIREFSSGFDDSSESVRQSVPEKVVVNDGDILFSWSATLEVKLWTGGAGALNQHIFRVTSDNYPKTFYYFEVLKYLEYFKMVAELRKTTMGHITKDHLVGSRISLPPKELIKAMDEKLSPILKKIVSNNQQNAELAKLRDWLLPMLMNGQVTLN